MVHTHVYTAVKTNQDQSKPGKIQNHSKPIKPTQKPFHTTCLIGKTQAFHHLPQFFGPCPVVPLGPVWHQRAQMVRCASGTPRLVQ
jgi:hypothetical protein